MCSTGIRYPAFRLVKGGAQLPLSAYTEDVRWRPAPFTATADVERVLAEFEAGATIVLQGLHLTWQPLAAFCRELERELGEAVQANAYLTPRSSQGLAVHHDTHDVFVLQVSGEKRWLVYEPALELPLRDQRHRRELAAPDAAVEDLVLRPGDTLYLPRGWLHEAQTSATDSLHVTVGVNVHSWLEAFKGALEECARADVRFRRSVPAGGEGAEPLLEALAEKLEPGLVASRKRRSLMMARRPILEGQLAQLRALDDLTQETLLERRPTVLGVELVVGGTPTGAGRSPGRGAKRVGLAFDGKQLSFPRRALPEVAAIAGAEEPFRPRDLPGQLDEAGRLVLVRRLVREGLLRIVEPRSGGRAPA